ncbi:MAG: tetratricopeptide repeat protein [Elusimicrobia bacterium]|nr:tetratricopeptide repeat protein [Candidatus Liberimonas magnetica]
MVIENKVMEINAANETMLIQTAKDSILPGNYNAGENILKKVIKINPLNEDAHFELGKLYFVNKNYLPAVKELKKTIGLNSKHLFAHVLLGKYYMIQKDYKSSLKEFNLVLKYNEGEGSVLYDMGNLYMEMKQYDSAIEKFESALKLGYKNHGLRYELAKAYKETGKYDKAKQELEIIQKEKPVDSSMQYKLGVLYRELGEFELSKGHFKKVSKMEPFGNKAFFDNLIQNETEISERKKYLKSKPMVLGITLSSRCNIKCKMCEVWSSPWDMPESIIEEIIGLFPYLKYIHWLGGEPFFHKRFKELFDKAASYPDLYQVIVTNGQLINDSWAEKLVKSNVNIILSIDGTTKKSYEAIRTGASFDKLIQNIKFLNKYKEIYGTAKSKINIILQTTIIKSNYHQLIDFVEFANKYRFDALNITPVRYIKSKENIFLNNDKKAFKYINDKMPAVIRKAKEYELKLLNILPKTGNCAEYPDDEPAPKDPSIKNNANNVFIKNEILCHWPWKSLFILTNGCVKPYGFCEEHIGNVTSQSLEEIWNGKLMAKYREKISKYECSKWCSPRCTSGVMPGNNLKLEV